jgi:hypothetical protein
VLSNSNDVISEDVRMRLCKRSTFDGVPKKERVILFDDHARKLRDVATISQRHFKIAICEMTVLMIRLSSMNLGKKNVMATTAAWDKSRSRGKDADNALVNKSKLRGGFKRKIPNVPIAFTRSVDLDFTEKGKTRHYSVCLASGVPREQCADHNSANPNCHSRLHLTEEVVKVDTELGVVSYKA